MDCKHSSAGSGEVYGNLWDPMSATTLCEANPADVPFAPHVIAYDKDLLGWIPADRKIVVAPQGTVTIELAALANPAAQGYLLAQIPIAGDPARFYTVEARLRVGYDRALPADAVLIHEIDPTRDPPARLVNHLGDGDTREAAGMWQPGDVFIDAAGGVAVAVENATATGFVVTIATGPLPWPLSSASATPLPAGDTAFDWQQVQGASGYELRVEPQSQRPAASPFTQVVPAVRTTISLPPGDYRWQVRALPDGRLDPAHARRNRLRWPALAAQRSRLGCCGHISIGSDHHGRPKTGGLDRLGSHRQHVSPVDCAQGPPQRSRVAARGTDDPWLRSAGRLSPRAGDRRRG